MAKKKRRSEEEGRHEEGQGRREEEVSPEAEEEADGRHLRLDSGCEPAESPPARSPYWHLRAAAALIRRARHVGTHAASTHTISSTIGAAPNTIGSAGSTP